MQILGLLGMYFDAVVVAVEKYLLFFRLALAIPCIFAKSGPPGPLLARAIALLSIFSNVPTFPFEAALSNIKIMIESIPPRTKNVNRKNIFGKVIGIRFSSTEQ